MGFSMNDNNLIQGQAEEHVIRASGLLSLLMPQASGVGIAVKGLDGRYRMINKAIETLFGKSTKQINGMTDADLFPPEIVALLQRSDEQISNGAAATSEELDLSLNGVPIPVLWLKFPILAPDGMMLSIGAVILDTSQKQVVTEMRQSMSHLQKTNQELHKTLVELERLASTDKLTGAWNRRRIEETVINEMDRLKRYDHPLSLLVIDIDFFKKINDQYGHAVGDRVLAQLAAIVQATLRASDSLTRWGGEEFVVLSPNTTRSTAAVLAERLRVKIATAEFVMVKHITVSIGVAECIAGETWEDWFKRADAALYRAKACGRNQVQIAPEAPERVGSGQGAGHFVHLAWHSAYECGNSVIDDQHRGLFADANKLLAAILSGAPVDEVAGLIDVLIGDVVQHFHDEEAIFTAAGYPGAVQHAAVHRQLVDSAGNLVGRFHAGTLGIGELFEFLARDVVAKHMLGADREFFPYLQDRH